MKAVASTGIQKPLPAGKGGASLRAEDLVREPATLALPMKRPGGGAAGAEDGERELPLVVLEAVARLHVGADDRAGLAAGRACARHAVGKRAEGDGQADDVCVARVDGVAAFGLAGVVEDFSRPEAVAAEDDVAGVVRLGIAEESADPEAVRLVLAGVLAEVAPVLAEALHHAEERVVGEHRVGIRNRLELVRVAGLRCFVQGNERVDVHHGLLREGLIVRQLAA